jgi:4'-phosphopantetheinyl transferase
VAADGPGPAVQGTQLGDELLWAAQPAESPALGSGDLHVWRADLDHLVSVDEAVLSEEERERAARFSSDRSRERWARGRAALRKLLGGYLGIDPTEIELESGERGKPRVAAGGIEFNLSHSGGLALFAFTRDNPVGVDVELAGRVRDPVAVAEREFGSAESERLRALPAADLEPEFLRIWVRHEAALKCGGEGLGAPAGGAEVTLLDLDLGPGAAGAVALERAPDAVSLWRFERPDESGS